MNPKSDLVRKMNAHFCRALVLIEEGAAANNAEIRDEMKNFFKQAEEIEKEIEKLEVSSINLVKQSERNAIEVQKGEVEQFLLKFEEKIAEIEENIRNVLGETSPLLSC